MGTCLTQRLYDDIRPKVPERHALHPDAIVKHWDEIQSVIGQELPSTDGIVQLMERLHMPMSPAELGISREDTQAAFIGSREIRDKYLTGSLLWDLGLLHEMRLAE